MKFLPLVGTHLKDDDMLELLEFWDAVVVYDFDRNHENIPDGYDVSIEAWGVELSFNEHQVLSTIFLYIEPDGDFEAINPLDIEDIQIFPNAEEVIAHCISHKIPFKKNTTSKGTWARIDNAEVSVHYEYRADALFRITIMNSESRP